MFKWRAGEASNVCTAIVSINQASVSCNLDFAGRMANAMGLVNLREDFEERTEHTAHTRKRLILDQIFRAVAHERLCVCVCVCVLHAAARIKAISHWPSLGLALIGRSLRKVCERPIAYGNRVRQLESSIRLKLSPTERPLRGLSRARNLNARSGF